jgi:small subunit ribosomal protein S16
VVAADQRSPRNGRFIEVIGVYDPRKDQEKLNLERVDYWLSQGAVPSETVAAIIHRVREGLPAPPRRQKKRYRDGQAAEEAETPAAVEAAPDEAAEPEVAESEPAEVAEPAAEAVAVEAEVAASASTEPTPEETVDAAAAEAVAAEAEVVASASAEPAPEETMDAAATEPAGAEAAEAADSDEERPAGA